MLGEYNESDVFKVAMFSSKLAAAIVAYNHSIDG
jgi:hypothetical protein